jgi:hypothetical protein
MKDKFDEIFGWMKRMYIQIMDEKNSTLLKKLKKHEK